jgi:hypothetical protein
MLVALFACCVRSGTLIFGLQRTAGNSFRYMENRCSVWLYRCSGLCRSSLHESLRIGLAMILSYNNKECQSCLLVFVAVVSKAFRIKGFLELFTWAFQNKANKFFLTMDNKPRPGSIYSSSSWL